jgi:hypothetical protein
MSRFDDEDYMVGTQLVTPVHKIPAPAYRILDGEIESTIDELHEQAIELGERVAQQMLAAGRSAPPFAHKACTYYHAIEAIRQLQADVALEKKRNAQLSAAFDTFTTVSTKKL